VNDRDKAQTQDLYSDIMLNHHLSQKLKLIGKIKFNHLIIKKKNSSTECENKAPFALQCYMYGSSPIP
jgi:hypothetical protein